MDSVKSGPEVFYQVMPGVTSDGKKVMKLIPGVMVNGKFVQTTVSQGQQTGAALQKLLPPNGSPALTSKKIVLDPPFTQQVINKVSLLNSTPNQATVKVNNVPNKQLAQHKNILVNQPLGTLETAVPAVPVVIKAQSLTRGQNVQLQHQKYFILKQPLVSTATGPAVNEKAQYLSHPPVTVNSVALPGGIPLNTKNRTIPVSELAPVIKKQLPTSTPGSAPSSVLQNVVSVTPITTAKQKTPPPSLKQPSQPSYNYFPGPGLQGATKHLKLVQKAPQGHNGPCKWVIEEVDVAAPEDAPPVTPKATSALAGKMEPVKRGATTPGPDPDSRPSRSLSGHRDAVMVCNGKVFVVANKSNDSSVTHKLSKPLLEQCEKEQDSSSGTPGRFTEVIDLCEDDDNGPSASSQDDDNVIFVSYVPPNPGTSHMIVTEQRSNPGDCAGKSDLPVARRRSPDRRGDNDLCGSAEVDGSRIPEGLKHAKPSQQEVVEEEKEVAVEEVVAEEVLEEEVMEQVITEVLVKEKSAVKELVPREVVEEAVEEEQHTIAETEISWAVVKSSFPPPPSPTPTPGRGCDRQLRQMFDITADLRIILQRVDDPSARFQVSSHNLCNSSGILLLKGEAQQEPSAAATTHIACLHGSRKSLTCSSPPGTYEVAESASFLEPIEEDFLSDDENQVHDGVWRSTSRGGRTRKRPRCPCCIPGSGVPTAKARLSEAEPVAARRSWKTSRQKTDKKKLDLE